MRQCWMSREGMDLERTSENESEYDQNILHEDVCAEDAHTIATVYKQ